MPFVFLFVSHLTFNSSCIIACLYVHPPSVVGFPPLEALSNFTHRCWDFSQSEAQLCCRDFPLSESQVHNSIDGSHSLWSTRESNSTTGISPTQRLKICRYYWWNYSTLEQCCRVIKPFSCQIKHSRIKIQHSEEGANTPIPKANGKTIEARSKQTFSF